MRCLIVDDEEMSRINLQILCGKIQGIELVASCESALEALPLLQNGQTDLLLLDVEMPGCSGLDLLRSAPSLPPVILITARRDYAADAFEFREQVADYLTKPVSLPRLLAAIERVRQQLHSAPAEEPLRECIFVKTEKRLVRIDLADLWYIETIGDYVRFQTASGPFIVHATLKSIDERLQHPDFFKVHRSYIVNLRQVVDIEENSLLIHQKIIPISRSNRAALLERIKPF